MKYFVILVLISFQFIASAQSKEHAGNYTLELGGGEHIETNKLTLNPNGTFLFHFYDNRKNGIPKERTKYGKGTWTSNKRLIYLKVEESDIDSTHVLNFNNSKLRFDTKSPRDKSNRDIKTSVRFYESEIPWMKGRTLIKGAKSMPVVNENKCCTSIWQVHSYLMGKWTTKDEPNKEYHYSFKDEKGYFDAYRKTGEGTLEPINEVTADVKILKTDTGFKIETDFKGIVTTSSIKHLDGNKLTTVRQDGKESALIRLKE